MSARSVGKTHGDSRYPPRGSWKNSKMAAGSSTMQTGNKQMQPQRSGGKPPGSETHSMTPNAAIRNSGELTDPPYAPSSPARSPSQAPLPSSGHASHTSSALDGDMADIFLSQTSDQEADSDNMQPSSQDADPDSPEGSLAPLPALLPYSPDTILLARFADMLQKELEKATTKPLI